MARVKQNSSESPPANGSERAEASRVEAVYERILLDIVRGELVGGTELKSTQLAQRLGFSRTPVVQALQRLAADGIVALEVNKRAVVRPGAENWLVEIHEIRELLEPHAAAMAAERVTPEDLARLQSLADAVKIGSGANWEEAAQRFDFELHLVIAARCGNFAMGETIRKCWSFKRLSYEAVPEKPESLEKGYREHLAVLQALKERDSQTASAAMLFHLRSAATSRPAKTIV